MLRRLLEAAYLIVGVGCFIFFAAYFLWNMGGVLVGRVAGIVALPILGFALAIGVLLGLSKIAGPVRAEILEVLENAYVQEIGYSVLVAVIVAPAIRYILGWRHLFSGYASLLSFACSLVVLDLTNRISGRRNPRDYLLALAVAVLVLAAVHPRPQPFSFP